VTHLTIGYVVGGVVVPVVGSVMIGGVVGGVITMLGGGATGWGVPPPAPGRAPPVAIRPCGVITPPGR
jgi:hypothetical protein